jgi:hypothetical protein
MDVTNWLLDSDPALRWQVLRDLTDAPDDLVAAERSRVASEGWGARLLALQGEDGQWAGGAHFPSPPPSPPLERGPDGRLVAQPWTATSWSLNLLRIFGLDPASPEARSAVVSVRENSRWEHAGQPFFQGEVEPCINGLVVAVGSYFGEDVASVVDRLVDEQMDDGGWNCEQENGSIRGSFHTTIAVLEGLEEYRRNAGPASPVSEALERGREYLLERRLFRRRSTGEVIDRRWFRPAFPTWWRYDVLRGLDHLRDAGGRPEARIEEAVDLVESARSGDGRWGRHVHPGAVHFDVDDPEGEPSRWITLRALRVSRWAGRLP